MCAAIAILYSPAWAGSWATRRAERARTGRIHGGRHSQAEPFILCECREVIKMSPGEFFYFYLIALIMQRYSLCSELMRFFKPSALDLIRARLTSSSSPNCFASISARAASADARSRGSRSEVGNASVILRGVNNQPSRNYFARAVR